MSLPRERLRWNGWGFLGRSAGFSRAQERAVKGELERRFGRPLARAPEPVDRDAVKLPDPRIAPAARDALRAACGEDGVRTGPGERLTHALGKSLPDLFRLRRGEVSQAPDAVVAPADEGAVAAVLRIAADADLCVVPFGGGTSVVGGVEPRPGPGQTGAIALDTTRLDAVVRIDPEAGTATFGAGIDGPALEAALAERGLTLGHFPQSFELSTLGGWIATRSTGQQSDGYGGIERLLVAARMVTPEGVVRTLPVPRSATGPDMNHWLLGSEGTAGVIVEATVRVAPAPRERRDRACLFRSFGDGLRAVRELARAGAPASMLRLSDEAETEVTQALARDPSRRIDATALALRALGALGFGTDAALVALCEGHDARAVRGASRRVGRAARAHGGVSVGGGPARHWREKRFHAPYLRDWLLDHGVAVDTMETAFAWGRVESAHAEVSRALRHALLAHAGAGLVMAHLSHSYPDGACLYFTVLYPFDPETDVAQWAAIKSDATEAIRAAGGTLSHHHGVGRDHRPWLAAEKGALSLEALRAAKRAVDPRSIMNPGILL